ncbi:MAG: hypothetical protein R2713_17665 [Ilumatobacteraceae bacterium]
MAVDRHRSNELHDAEEAGLSLHRTRSDDKCAIAFAWAAARASPRWEGCPGGDFVRTTKQLIDVLRQLALVAPVPATRVAAERAADALFRGVVSASSTAGIE